MFRGLELIHDALDEPGIGVTFAKHAIGRPVGQRHVPLVAIPRTVSIASRARDTGRALRLRRRGSGTTHTCLTLLVGRRGLFTGPLGLITGLPRLEDVS